MNFYREITEWADIQNVQPNHVYLMDHDYQAIAYSKLGKDPLFFFKEPLKLNRRGRKFIKVRNTFGWIAEPKAPAKVSGWIVLGSKGDKYVVTAEGTCTCIGFGYRGTCKHLLSIQNQALRSP